jgi:thymidine kinase
MVYLHGVMGSKKSLFLAKFMEGKMEKGFKCALYTYTSFIVRDYTPNSAITAKSFKNLDFKTEIGIWDSLDYLFVDEAHFLTPEQLQSLYVGVRPILNRKGTVIIVSLQRSFKNEEFPIYLFLTKEGIPSSEVRWLDEALVLSGHPEYAVANCKLCDKCKKNIATTHVKKKGNPLKILEEGHDFYYSACYSCWEEANKLEGNSSQNSAENSVVNKFSLVNQSPCSNASPSPFPNGFSTPFTGAPGDFSSPTIALANSDT